MNRIIKGELDVLRDVMADLAYLSVNSKDIITDEIDEINEIIIKMEEKL